MAIFHQQQQQQQQQQQTNSFFLDELYCDEEQICETNNNDYNNNNNDDEENKSQSFLLPLMLLEQDLSWEEDDEELKTLFSKEKQGNCYNYFKDDFSLINMNARKNAIEWMLKINNLYGFCNLTSILCVNYFDRCISNIPFINQDKPWTIQLAAVACLSIAAKVEETSVPFLLDLQVEGARPMFEPKDVQKMEILVLSTLEWKMHPVTSLSFVHHIIRRLGLNHHLHWEFLNRCERLLISLLPDWRFVNYLPSVLATATMMHVIDQIQHFNSLDYQNHLINVLHITKEKVNDCYELIKEISIENSTNNINNSKRKFDQISTMNNNTIPSSPSGVIDAYAFSSDSSNDSWGATTTNSNNIIGLSSVSSSVSSSPVTSKKKGRVRETPMPLQLPSLSRVFVDLVESPR